MPELPEVEIVTRSLKPHLLNRTIKKIEIYTNKLRQIIPESLIDQVNHQIIEIKRKAKYIIITTSAAEEIIAHLGMTGNFSIKKESEFDKEKHDHVAIYLDNGTLLIYNDPRKFGLITITSQIPKSFDQTAIDATSDIFTDHYLYHILKKFPKAPIKLALMNNNIVSGIGNIYANEALFQAQLLPTRKAATLALKDIGVLVNKSKQVLLAAIAAGGSTIKDYKNATGEQGYFQQQLLVYGRDKQPCTVCSTAINRMMISGRSTFFCPHCQK